MLHYLKFTLFHCFALAAISSVFVGGMAIPITFVVTSSIIVLGDLFLGDDLSEPNFHHENILVFLLHCALPLTFLLLCAGLWQISPDDVFGMGAALTTLTGFDFNVAKANTSLWQKLAAIPYIGLMLSTLGTVTGHELIHRTYDKASLVIGRWLLAFSFDSNFSIEHVYNHHRWVATPSDPASAPRGRNVYQHIVLSTIGGNISAWNIEKKRLAKRQLPIFSVANVCLRGYAMSLVLVVWSIWMAGLWGAVFFVVCGLWAKTMLEIVNYMEHYGLVRDASKRVEPRHSWNTNRRISSWSMFNLSRHSHHHAHGHVPFYQLTAMPDSPTLPSGYLGCMLVTLIPPLWFKLMAPRLAWWDAHLATEQERALIKASAGQN